MVDVCRLWRHRRSTLACRQSTVADKGDTDVRAIASLPNKATEPGPTHRRLRSPHHRRIAAVPDAAPF